MGNSTQQNEVNGGTPLAEPLGSDDDWVDCWNCGGEGYEGHDCGEDCCGCADPEPNVPCHVCHGKGGWKNPNNRI